VAALLGSLLLQMAANLANDVFDHEKGADNAERLGPTRVVQAGLLSARQVRRGMVLCFVLATAVGVYLVHVAGPVVIFIGLLSIGAALAYTAGPYPLGYHGWGDVFVMAFFGFAAVAGTARVQLDHIPNFVWLASVPPGALSTAILVINNIRDRHTDSRAGKRTLAVRLGRSGAFKEYVALLLLAYATPLAFWLLGWAGPIILAPWLTLPIACFIARRVARHEGRDLNLDLASTARLTLLFGVLFAVAIAWQPGHVS
jgi:1,4-dihydroxy-2-naphthoate octaprenyltransferase